MADYGWCLCVHMCVWVCVCELFHKLERLALLLAVTGAGAFICLWPFGDFCQGFSFYDVVQKTLLCWYFAMQSVLPTQTYHPIPTKSACGAYGILHVDFLQQFCKYTLSRPKVLVRAKPQPCSKALRIMAALVVGGALASPNGLGNLIPHISTLMSTVSMAQWNKGSLGVVLTVLPWRDCRENIHTHTKTHIYKPLIFVLFTHKK